MKNSIKLILFAVLGFSNHFLSQEKNLEKIDTLKWHKLGETTINYENDRNEILVVSKAKFNKLQFVVKLAPVEIVEMVIFYKNGDQQKIPIEETIKSEGFRSILELNGKERIISKVVFQSRTLANLKEKRAIIEIWGKNDLD